MLREAGGRVRCNDCDNEFTAPEYVSEEKQVDQNETPAGADKGNGLVANRTAQAVESEKLEHVTAPHSEEADSMDRQIDEELLRATQTLDVFASERDEGQNIDQFPDKDFPMAETIVMEGETVHSTSQGDRRKSDRNGSEVNFPEWMKDTYSQNRGANRDYRRAGDPPRDSSGNWSGFTAIVSFVLVILFLFWQISR